MAKFIDEHDSTKTNDLAIMKFETPENIVSIKHSTSCIYNMIINYVHYFLL